MERNDIMKALYKQNPTALLLFIRMGVAYYTTILEGGKVVNLNVPVADMGTADFNYEMPAKHLSRWIVPIE